MVYEKRVRVNLVTGETKVMEIIPLPEEDPTPYREAQANYYATALMKARKESNDDNEYFKNDSTRAY